MPRALLYLSDARKFRVKLSSVLSKINVIENAEIFNKGESAKDFTAPVVEVLANLKAWIIAHREEKLQPEIWSKIFQSCRKLDRMLLDQAVVFLETDIGADLPHYFMLKIFRLFFP